MSEKLAQLEKKGGEIRTMYGAMMFRDQGGVNKNFGNIDDYWQNGANVAMACDTEHLRAANGYITFKAKSRVTIYNTMNSSVTVGEYNVNDTLTYPTTSGKSQLYVFEAL